MFTVHNCSILRKSRAVVAERMQTREEKRALNRKLQRESRLKKNSELEGTTMKIDSMFARTNAANENIN